CPLLAQSGHHDPLSQCPLLGVKRTSRSLGRMSAFDPKRTSAAKDCCRANWLHKPSAFDPLADGALRLGSFGSEHHYSHGPDHLVSLAAKRKPSRKNSR